MASLTRKKVVIVGDGACGKTCLLGAHFQNKFFDEYQPTIFETYVYPFEVDNIKLELAFWDTAGIDDYELLRPLSYTDANVILMCYSIESPVSLKNIFDKWMPEIKYHCPRTPIVLVATKADLRDDAQTREDLKRWNSEPVRKDEGETMRKRINAVEFLECSSRAHIGVQKVFETVARVANHTNNQRFRPHLKHRTKCVSL